MQSLKLVCGASLQSLQLVYERTLIEVLANLTIILNSHVIFLNQIISCEAERNFQKLSIGFFGTRG
jgi:hypothetical protein